MGHEATSRRRNEDGNVVLVRVRDLQLLKALRSGKPEAKGRRGRCLSQRQIAAELGISSGHYGDIEIGRRHPSLAVAKRIAAFYGIDESALVEEIPLFEAAS